MNKLLVGTLSAVVALSAMVSNADASQYDKSDACRTYHVNYGDVLDYDTCPVMVVMEENGQDADNADVYTVSNPETCKRGKCVTVKIARPHKENIPSKDRPVKDVTVTVKPTK